MVISKHDLVRIETAIKELEAKTSLEIVTVLLPRCESYFYVRLSYTLMMGLLAGVLTHNLVWGLVASVFFWILLSIENLWSYWIPKRERHDNVAEEAYRQFLLKEVFATQSRSGILIFISYAEKSVFVLADKGLREFVSDSEWSLLGARLAEELSRQSVGDTFLEAIRELEKKIPKDHFKGGGQNPNELPDQLHRS